MSWIRNTAKRIYLRIEAELPVLQMTQKKDPNNFLNNQRFIATTTKKELANSHFPESSGYDAFNDRSTISMKQVNLKTDDQ
jgi:hypothetical protein